MPPTFRVLFREGSAIVPVELLASRVDRLIDIEADCGCWKHSGRVFPRFTILVTAAGAYVRADGDVAFREVDQHGPVRLEILRAYRPEPE